MTSARRRLYVAVAAALTLLAAAPAEAQLIRTRPFRGIFRTTQDPAESRHRLDFSAFLAGGYDDVAMDVDGISIPLDDRLNSATFGSFVMSGVYAHTGRRTTLSAAASSSLRYYQTLGGQLSPMSASGHVAFSGRAGQRGSFALSQGASYSPYYVFSLAPTFLQELFTGPTPVFDADRDLRATRRATYAYTTNASYSQRFARRASVSVNYGVQYVDATSGAFDQLSHSGGIRLSREIGRYMGIHGGVGGNTAAYLDSPFDSLASYNIDAGFSYGRPLPFSRRTRVSFSTGSGFARQEGSTQFFLVGNASVLHQFTRTWTVAGSYHRGNDVMQGFAQPFFTFTDSVGVSVSGRVKGPVTLSTTGSYSHGTFKVSRVRNVTDSGSAAVRVNVPIIWFLTSYAEAYYARFRFANRVGLLPDIPLSTERLGVRAGVNFILPVVR